VCDPPKEKKETNRCNSTFLSEDADEGEEEESGASGEEDESDESEAEAMKKPAKAAGPAKAAKAAGPAKAAGHALKRPAAKVAAKAPKVAKGKAAPPMAPPMKAMKGMKAKVAEKKAKKPKIATFIVPVGGKRPHPSFTPCHYKGGCIYWSKSKKSWRVYLRRIDKVEVSVNLGADAETAEKSMIAKQWRKCLKAIELDPRPLVA